MEVPEKIQDFLSNRKEEWLKKRINDKLTQEEVSFFLQDAEEKFSAEIWIKDAANRAKQLYMVTHPSKFSHPSSNTTPVIAKLKRSVDGYLRTGNVSYEMDVFGNAAAMDVYKFLMLEMGDGQSVLSNLEQNSDEAMRVFDFADEDYKAIREKFLSIKEVSDNVTTDKLVKQVYFPLENGTYHLLSLLTPSGLVFELKSRIDYLRFSDEAKEARECRRVNKEHVTGYDDILDLTVVGYGGTKPQNISVLNNRNGGKAYLLKSAPPELKKRSVRLPNRDFFRTNLRRKMFAEEFESLYKLTKLEVNNKSIRNGINNIIRFIIGQVIEQVFKVRKTGGIGWTKTDYYAYLPKSQAIWLDDAYIDDRALDGDWIEDIVKEITTWFILSFEESAKESNILLGGNESSYVKDIVKELIEEDLEVLK